MNTHQTKDIARWLAYWDNIDIWGAFWKVIGNSLDLSCQCSGHWVTTRQSPNLTILYTLHITLFLGSPYAFDTTVRAQAIPNASLTRQPLNFSLQMSVRAQWKAFPHWKRSTLSGCSWWGLVLAWYWPGIGLVLAWYWPKRILRSGDFA